MRLVIVAILLAACNGAPRGAAAPECKVAADCVLYDPPECCNDPCDGLSAAWRAVPRAVLEREQAASVERCKGKQLDCPKPECDRTKLPAVDCRAGACVVVAP